MKGLYEKLQSQGKTPDFRELVDTVMLVARGFSRVWIFFDALDECDETTQRVDLLSAIQRFMKAGISGFATSRSHPKDIQFTFMNTRKIELLARATDIRPFVREQIAPHIQNQVVVEEIVSHIAAKADGMYAIVIDTSIKSWHR